MWSHQGFRRHHDLLHQSVLSISSDWSISVVYQSPFTNNRSIPSLLSITFLKDPTDPQDQRHLLLLYGLRFRQFRWFLICRALTCRDSNTSLHKHVKNQRFMCMSNAWFLIWWHDRCFVNIVHRLAHIFSLDGSGSNIKKRPARQRRDDAANQIHSLHGELYDPPLWQHLLFYGK